MNKKEYRKIVEKVKEDFEMATNDFCSQYDNEEYFDNCIFSELVGLKLDVQKKLEKQFEKMTKHEPEYIKKWKEWMKNREKNETDYDDRFEPIEGDTLG